MNEDQQLLFVCKYCNKKFPCGKSLGGHIRSHNRANSSESDEKLGFGPKKTVKDAEIAEFKHGQPSYVLRENRRRTWRSADSNSQHERVCNQCGKVFQSLKALCGHMACHSQKDKSPKYDDSWTRNNSENQVFDSQSDTETEDLMVIRTRSSSCKKLKKVNSHQSSLPSSGSEIHGDEQEALAKCLMMLSRDKGEPSDNNSVVIESKSSPVDPKQKEAVRIKNNLKEKFEIKDGNKEEIYSDAESSDSGYFLDGCGKEESEVSFEGFQKTGTFNRFESLNRSKDQYHNAALASYFAAIDSGKRRQIKRNENPDSAPSDDPQKRSKYECFNCKKTFKSHQALGGHRPCHKRTNAYYETSEQRLEDSMELANVKNQHIESSSSKGKSSAKSSSQTKDKGKKNQVHVCPYCDRVFKSGQALGGHKRSHLLGGNDEGYNNHIKEETHKPELFDLNLPAAQDDDDEASG